MPGDRLRPGVQTGLGQLLTPLDDGLLDIIGCPVRVAPRSTRARLERGLAVEPVAPHEDLYPLPADAVVAGDLALGPALDDHRHDQDSGHRHRPPPLRSGCKRCRETPANYVLNSDTLSSTKEPGAIGPSSRPSGGRYSSSHRSRRASPFDAGQVVFGFLGDVLRTRLRYAGDGSSGCQATVLLARAALALRGRLKCPHRPRTEDR